MGVRPELPCADVKALPAPPRALAEMRPPAEAHPPAGPHQPARADQSGDAPAEEESVWQVFKRSYREARARHRGGGEPPTA